MFCENCGTPLEDGAKFCPNCGSKVTDSAPAAEPTSTSYAEPTYAQPAYTEQQATASDQSAKLYYPDPNRYVSYMSFDDRMAMNAADDIDDFQNS